MMWIISGHIAQISTGCGFISNHHGYHQACSLRMTWIISGHIAQISTGCGFISNHHGYHQACSLGMTWIISGHIAQISTGCGLSFQCNYNPRWSRRWRQHSAFDCRGFYSTFTYFILESSFLIYSAKVCVSIKLPSPFLFRLLLSCYMNKLIGCCNMKVWRGVVEKNSAMYVWLAKWRIQLHAH